MCGYDERRNVEVYFKYNPALKRANRYIPRKRINLDLKRKILPLSIFVACRKQDVSFLTNCPIVFFSNSVNSKVLFCRPEGDFVSVSRRKILLSIAKCESTFLANHNRSPFVLELSVTKNRKTAKSKLLNRSFLKTRNR